MDVEWTSANDLERALVCATTDPGARPEFYRLLLSSDLFFLTPDTNVAEGTRVAGAGESLSLVFWRGESGSFLPIFSSRERMQEVVGRGHTTYGFVAMAGSVAFKMISQSPCEAALNPGLPYGKRFVPDEIRAIGEGSICAGVSITVRQETQVLLGQPAVYPKQLVEHWRTAFTRHGGVEAAFLAQIHDPSSGAPPHLLVGIQGRDFRRAAEDAGLVARQVLRDGECVDFVEVVPDGTGIVEYLCRETTPFYEARATMLGSKAE